MTKADARMIAEELFRLMKKNGQLPGDFMERNGCLPETYMTLAEAAEYMKMTKDTLYRKKAQIPHTKKGKRIIFRMSDLHKYLNN